MYGLIWIDEAMDQLADAFVAATTKDRERIAASIESLNLLMRDDPFEVGESRDGTFRIAFSPLVSIIFNVSTSEQLVKVILMKRYGK